MIFCAKNVILWQGTAKILENQKSYLGRILANKIYSTF